MLYLASIIGHIKKNDSAVFVETGERHRFCK
jgi:hypothetical protein